MSVTTPSTGQKISDFSAGNVDANSYFIQANGGSTSKVSASQIGQFSNLNLLFSGAGGLDTTAKTIVGAINEVNAAIDEVDAKTGSDIAVSSSSSETIAEAINNPDVTVGTFTANANINLLRSTLIKVNSIKFLSVIFNVREASDTIGTMSSGFEASHNYDFTIANDNGTSTRARINKNNILSFTTTTPVQGSYYALTIAYI